LNLPLFCFGSLMDRDVLGCVIGDEAAAGVKMEQAWLGGYRKVRLPHETYPMLVPEAEKSTEGVLIYGLEKDHLDRIVFFEGEEYELTPCQVKTEKSCSIEALFFDEGIMPAPYTVEWDYQHWLQHHKEFMIRQSRKYMSYYGLMSAAEADVYWQNYSE